MLIINIGEAKLSLVLIRLKLTGKGLDAPLELFEFSKTPLILNVGLVALEIDASVRVWPVKPEIAADELLNDRLEPLPSPISDEASKVNVPAKTEEPELTLRAPPPDPVPAI